MYSNMGGEQSVKEFVRRSGVDLQPSGSNSNSNNNFARELELNMLKRQESPKPTGAFRHFENSNSNEPLGTEFNNINKMLNNKNTMREVLAPFPTPTVSPLEIGKLKPGLFNANVDSGFGQSVDVIDLKNILLKVPLGKTPIGQGLYLDTQEAIGRYGSMTKGFSHTRENGAKGDINKKYFTVQFMCSISDNVETKRVRVNIFKNGKIGFSGGFLTIGSNIANQAELIRRFIVNSYTQRQKFLYNPFTYNNLSGQFKINGVCNMQGLATQLRQHGAVSYEPELSPMLYVLRNDHTLNISRSGNVQIVGAKTPEVLQEAYTLTAQMLTQAFEAGNIQVTGPLDDAIKKSKPKAKAKAKAKAKPKAKAIIKNMRVKRVYKKRNLSENQMKSLKVSGKGCERLQRGELIDLAKTFGIVDFRVKGVNGSRFATKAEICEMMRKKTNTRVFPNTNKKQNSSLSGKGAMFRIGKTLCNNTSKKELERIAKVLKIQLESTDTKPTICKKIEKFRNTPISPPKPQPTKRQVQRVESNKRTSNTREKTIKKRGLNDNSIRKQLEIEYGSKWMKRYTPNLTRDVQNIKRSINGLKPNKSTSLPFKGDVKKVEQNMVRRWKMERRNALERKFIMNTINMTGIPYNLRNSWRNMASNYVMNHVRNHRSKAAPSKKKMEEYRTNWLKRRNNARQTGINRTVKARVEKM
jgi:TATA-box binding protein (TBP) (component of TFIID and TFIIIB)